MRHFDSQYHCGGSNSVMIIAMGCLCEQSFTCTTAIRFVRARGGGTRSGWNSGVIDSEDDLKSSSWTTCSSCHCGVYTLMLEDKTPNLSRTCKRLLRAAHLQQPAQQQVTTHTPHLTSHTPHLTPHTSFKCHIVQKTH